MDQDGRFRATSDHVRERLFASPSIPWSAPDKASEGLILTLRSEVDVEWLRNALTEATPRGAAWNGHTEVQIFLAGEYVRAEQSDKERAASAWLHHPKLGGVYIDLEGRSFIHFGPEQSVQVELPKLRGKVADWNIEKSDEPQTVTIVTAGPPHIACLITLTEDPSLRAWGPRLLDLLFAERAQLEASRFPIAELNGRGAPIATETWLLDSRGKKLRRLAAHRLENVTSHTFDPLKFAVPRDFEDLRRRETEKGVWYPAAGNARRTRRQVTISKSAKSKKGSATARGQAFVAPGALAQFVPPKPQPPEIALDACLPSTLQTICAVEIRQRLIDHLRVAANLFGGRMTQIAGTRNNNGDLAISHDWLSDMKALSDARTDAAGNVIGDALYCMLRDEPPIDDPLGGGGGLLDRAAEARAEVMVEADNPTPLGGAAAPLVLPLQVTLEVAAVTGNAAIPRDQRWQRLSRASQVAIREAVTTQQLGVFALTLNADVDNEPLPSRELDYMWVTLRAQTMTVSFDGTNVVAGMSIVADDPHVAIDAGVAGIAVTFDLERAPGLAFWVTAVGALVLGGVILITAAPIAISALVVLGPFGFPIIAGLLGGMPTIGVLGGVAIALTTFLMFDIASVSASITAPRFVARIETDVEGDVLGPFVESLTISGDLTVTYSSELPTGVHQGLATALSSLVSDTFETDVLDKLGERFAARLTELLRELPHLSLPHASTRSVPIEIANIGPIETRILEHELVGINVEAQDSARLAAATLSRMILHPLEAGLYVTQCDLDAPARLRSILDTEPESYAGYAFSQNLLNGFAQSMWIDGILRAEVREADLATGVAALVTACPKIGDPGACTAHVWAASSPRIQLTPRAFCENLCVDDVPCRNYMAAYFDDLRLCISCADSKSILEVQFAAQCVAHLGLGRNDAGTGRLSLVGATGSLADIFFDNTDGRFEIAPTGLQALAGSGPAFAVFEALDCDCRVAALDALQPLLRAALVRVLRVNPIRRVPFGRADALLNEHIYDGMLHARFIPHRATLYVVLSPFGGFQVLRPFSTNPGASSIDLATCEQGRGLLG